jgi:hypothetical protein
VDGDHGPLRWCLLLNHHRHYLRRHLRLPLRLHDILKDSFGGPGLTDRSQPQSCPTTAFAVASSEEVDLDKKVVRE